MERLDERHDDELVELGKASVETRGGAVGNRDQIDEKLPISGIADE